MKTSVGHRTALSLIASAAFLFSTPIACLHAADAPPTTEELLQRINSLEQEIKDLKAKVEQQQTAVPPGAVPVQPGIAGTARHQPIQALKPTAFISAGSDGFIFNSGDSNFVIGLHGLLQVDSRTFFSDDKAKGNDSFLLRRARPILSGTVYHDFDFLFTPEFAGNVVQILDAEVNYRLMPELQLQIGKMKPPVGLEALQPRSSLSSTNGRWQPIWFPIEILAWNCTAISLAAPSLTRLASSMAHRTTRRPRPTTTLTIIKASMAESLCNRSSTRRTHL
jgi:hypothetical protein